MAFTRSIAALLCAVLSVTALPQRRQSSDLEVDVGYAIYQGFSQSDSGLNAWQGMRYAAPPIGNLRWQPPQAPAEDRGSVTQANAPAPQCPQTPQSPPPAQGYAYQGDEDCLFLSVYAPPGAENLPVVFYIHGGGYGTGNGQQDFGQLSQVNNYTFVSVAIQYRLEAFGFLSSADVQNNGTANAALLDQHFALEWVQNNIAKFGGDPTRVTIVGQSAGAGSGEMQALAYGGSESTKYFQQIISSSPFTPVMYNYFDSVPTTYYLRFAQVAGCYSGDTNATANFTDPSILSCLRQANTSALQLASYQVGSGATFGAWAFVPVVDGDFIQQRPSEQLTSGKVNGARVLTSNNADEGSQFVTPNITSEADFNAWLFSEYPMLTFDDIDQINNVYYPLEDQSDINFATCGDCAGPTAVNVGSFAVGNLQRAVNFWSEATIVCPSYWFAAAYNGADQAGYKYQFSIPAAEHGLDLSAEALTQYPNFLVPNIGPQFFEALTVAWGNFITTGNPSISNLLANGNMTGNYSSNPASSWPTFSLDGANAYQMLNWNQTGGTPYTLTLATGYPPVTQNGGPGLNNSISLVNASSWEGGRGARCNFLKTIGANIPV